jgi:polar amino acid transport system substrate-binding protein
MGAGGKEWRSTMHRRTRLGIAAVGLAFVLLAAACANKTTTGNKPKTLLDQIMASKQLKISTDPKYPPQSSFDAASNTWKGFDIDVATEITHRLLGPSVQPKWETPNWDSIIAGHWNGRWDVSVGSMTITPDRAKVLDFTPPYYYTPAGFAVYKTNTSIHSAADLTGKKVGSCGGCTYEQYLKGTLKIPNYSINFGIHGAQIVTYDTDSTAIQDLSLGDCLRLCAAFSAIPTLQAAIKAGKPIKIIGPPLFYEPLAVAVDKSSSLDPTSFVDKLSQIVNQMHQDGTLSRLSEKWYGTDLTVAQGG